MNESSEPTEAALTVVRRCPHCQTTDTYGLPTRQPAGGPRRRHLRGHNRTNCVHQKYGVG
jgi:hypothetical protein